MEIDLMIVLNATVTDFLINLQVEDHSISNTKIVQDNIGMFYHNYDALLTSVLHNFVFDFNESHQNGIDLKKNLTVKFVAGLLRQSIITPYQEDGFIYGGFKWISDF